MYILYSLIPNPIVEFHCFCLFNLRDQTKSLSRTEAKSDKYFVIDHENSTLKWYPSNQREWKDNYRDLTKEICKQSELSNNEFKLQDAQKCEITDGDDLEAVWISLNANQSKVFEEIEIIQKRPDSINVNDTKSTTMNVYKMDWYKACNAIHHEMWPKLASAVTATIDKIGEPKIDKNKFKQEDVKIVIDKLVEERHLPTEERIYLQGVLQRASEFNLDNTRNTKSPCIIGNTDKDFHIKMKGLNESLLMDIYDVHSIFKYFIFNYKEYTINDYKKDIHKKRCMDVLGQKFIKQYIDTASFALRYNLHNNYIVDDDMFRLFEYHFGVSLFVNKIKNHLFISYGQCFVVQSIVIPHSVSSIYTEKMKLNCDITHIENYFLERKLHNFCKTKLKSNIPKNSTYINDIIMNWFDIDEIKRECINKMMIIIDKRGAKDLFYACTFQNNQQFLPLNGNYVIGFDFKVCQDSKGSKNKVITHFKYGQDQLLRFFPEMLTTLIPTIFRSPTNISRAQYLDKIYDHSFKHAWCVTLEDETFEKYYKIVTGFDHIHVNYNRQLLHEQFHTNKPMLCFMDLLNEEIQNEQQESIESFHKHLEDNEYDSESLVDDVMFERDFADQSNIYNHLHALNQSALFENIDIMMERYFSPSQKEIGHQCGDHYVFQENKCSFIQIIIDSLKQFKSGNYNKIQLMQVIEAYDHIITTHKLCMLNPSAIEKVENKQEFESFDVMANSKTVSPVQAYIVKKLGGFCTKQECPILHKHIRYRREDPVTDDTKDDVKVHDKDGLNEITEETMNAIHCYILHSKKELFRMKRSVGHSQFVSALEKTNANNDENNDENDDEKSEALPSINFGLSVLEWFNYGEQSTFESFDEEIISNPESTVNEKMYLKIKQECFIKMNNVKQEQFLLNEIVSLKLYTDMTSYQSSLRKAFWHSSGKDIKKLYYHWALQLYKTFLYHSQHLPRLTKASKSPLRLYHGTVVSSCVYTIFFHLCQMSYFLYC